MEDDTEAIVEVAMETADEKGVPIVLLGGRPDHPIADLLRMSGAQFLHAQDMSCTPRAVYIIAEPRYGEYRFATGSVVLDQFASIADQPGVTVHRKEVLVDD
ncbi:hypothetical protein SEA_HANNACONDA_16 [Mycobacterium phage Hannaconda]|uniref:Uncharacterized protein n=2 Tax=Omegavirus courthouse TaxID=1089119 RepID=G8I576_9CAUD|nr:hypothetical protein CM09_gp019 [Mycobacterium phage Courthouse]YP_009213236.1 hypothetical protein AVV70_gp019 [Mycobacterium phage MiaZeal]ASD50660.1 hypothetical protein PORCELAIN_19 [Mycobacterium phage Porcelain]ATS92862.1 hypothetical protein SEA_SUPERPHIKIMAN_19 [Mycobacterium phage Superphikiman]QGJ93659.1 hypothetical protein SEA_HANNACONDA_16 [Mycobacterium phage Hannaconda]QPO16623.1 hypothetical protein SEA_KASHFLOW_13 [Mycobacterium phage KashFlow]AER47870.1 hypothetical prote